MFNSFLRHRITWALLSAWLLPCVWAFEASSRPDDLTLQVAYGSEKEKWINAVTKTFNEEGRLTQSKRKIKVTLVKRGSGEMFEDLFPPELTPTDLQHHLVSPAANAYLEYYNEVEQERLRGVGKEPRPLVDKEHVSLLFSSPIVLMVWEDLARDMGWGIVGRNPRWRDIFDYARTPRLWQGVAGPGQVFRLGHTHPFYSNSGFHALFLEAYAASNTFQGLNMLQLNNNQDKVTQYLREVEEKIPHYDKSTGDLAKLMLKNGREYFSAVIVYENSVFEYNIQAKKEGKPRQVVAVYPEEGTFLSDHPIGAVDRPWVTEEHREAGQIYVNYLLERPRQELAAKAYGFRPNPGLKDFSLDGILSTSLGVDPKTPKTIEAPRGSVIVKLRPMWLEAKSPCDVILAIDISGSMKEKNEKGQKRIDIVHDEIPKFIEKFRQENGPSGSRLSLILFGPQEPELYLHEDLVTKDRGDQASELIRGLQPDGDTPLFQAVALARTTFDKWPPPINASKDRRRNRAIVVFSDGKDSRNKMKLEELLDMLAPSKSNAIPVHTIGFGKEKGLNGNAFLADLEKISTRTKGKFHAIEVDQNAVKDTFESIIMMY